jgi:CheY-like chemotaxis protein
MPVRILVCDDDEHVRSLIATVLRRRGHSPHVVARAQAALDELATARFDLVILDVHMPGIGGLDVLRQIRSDPAQAATRVLLLSGAKEALEAGWSARVDADAQLAKPFAIADFDAAVRSLLEPR